MLLGGSSLSLLKSEVHGLTSADVLEVEFSAKSVLAQESPSDERELLPKVRNTASDLSRRDLL